MSNPGICSPRPQARGAHLRQALHRCLAGEQHHVGYFLNDDDAHRDFGEVNGDNELFLDDLFPGLGIKTFQVIEGFGFPSAAFFRPSRRADSAVEAVTPTGEAARFWAARRPAMSCKVGLLHQSSSRFPDHWPLS